MSILFISIIIVLLLVIVFRQARKRRLLKNKTITIDEALEAWRKEELFIDVRTAEEYAQGHVPGAVLIPLVELPARMSEIPKDSKVHIICRSGNRSASATLSLLDQQYDNVYNVDGGMLQWKGPVEISK